MVNSIGPVLPSPINCKVSSIMHHESCLSVLQTQRKQCHIQNSIRVGLISVSAIFGMIFPRKINCSFPSEFVSSGHVSVGETRFCKCRVAKWTTTSLTSWDFSEQSPVGNSHQYGINLTLDRICHGVAKWAAGFIIRLKIKFRKLFAPSRASDWGPSYCVGVCA